MASTGKMNMSSLNGPLNDVAARNTHKMAVTRNYISQPRISKYIISVIHRKTQFELYYEPFGEATTGEIIPRHSFASKERPLSFPVNVQYFVEELTFCIVLIRGG